MRYLTNIILCLSLILAGCPNQTNNDYVASPGFSQEKFSEIRFKWGVKSLSWLILTDREHIVRSEDFALNELTEKLEQVDEK